MEAGIFLCHWYFLFTAWRKRRKELEGEQTSGDPEAAISQQESEIEVPSSPHDVPLNPIFRTGSLEETIREEKEREG
jgi:hypothetical protein